jgi:hypothetical protein
MFSKKMFGVERNSIPESTGKGIEQIVPILRHFLRLVGGLKSRRTNFVQQFF